MPVDVLEYQAFSEVQNELAPSTPTHQPTCSALSFIFSGIAFSSSTSIITRPDGLSMGVSQGEL
jgi:hypothetical protein